MKHLALLGPAVFAALASCGGSGAHLSAANDAGSGPLEDASPPPAPPQSDAAADATPGEAGPADAGQTTRVRIMAANLTSGTQQSYAQPGIDIFQGLAPDVVMIQEFKYASGDLRALVDTAFGTTFSFFVEPRTGGIPNGIVSRFPILASGVWTDASVTDRAFVYAQIDVPGPIDLWAVSVHLLTTGATQRATEATQLAGYIQSTVPAGDYVAIAGDFNTDDPGEQALSTLSSVVTADPPYPADQNGNTFSSINRDHPHDWVLPSRALDALSAPVTIGAASFPNGLIFDSRVYTPLTDVAPVALGDSAASGMQHMPVVRDFLVSGE